MSKIHALLKDWDKYRGSQWAEDAIVDPWNAALRLLKAVIALGCLDAQEIRDTIALMEGDLPADETVV